MKSERQAKIRELILKYPIDTQKALTAYLKEAGYDVTQATVSRDISELGLKKVSEKGVIKYVYADERPADKEKFIRVLRDGFVSCERAATLVVIKTVSGMAMAVAAALDDIDFEENIGTIAGDDTIMCAASSEADAISLLDKIKKFSDVKKRTS